MGENWAPPTNTAPGNPPSRVLSDGKEAGSTTNAPRNPCHLSSQTLSVAGVSRGLLSPKTARLRSMPVTTRRGRVCCARPPRLRERGVTAKQCEHWCSYIQLLAQSVCYPNTASSTSNLNRFATSGTKFMNTCSPTWFTAQAHAQDRQDTSYRHRPARWHTHARPGDGSPHSRRASLRVMSGVRLCWRAL